MITPKQAYEAAKVLWPGTTKLQKHPLGWYAMEIHTDGRASAITYGSGVPIDWGDTDQYPLPESEPEWVDAVFPDDVGKEGRLSNNKDAWTYEMIRGRNMYGDWICDSGLRRNCQVRKVNT
jgi:hypothetical protein